MSPRPRKPRFCRCPFRHEGETVFKPAGTPMKDLETVILLHDELEALILCDAKGLTQEEAGALMGVSRGTVQRLSASARGKTASALAGGKAIVLQPWRGSSPENDRKSRSTDSNIKDS